mmetsp:Transcript_94793/g.131758  ORF Transcript_94793/g.131758 Transcript_94793/m.131758 type:complete len:126 (+) Transcript_94793:562-939(+)
MVHRTRIRYLQLWGVSMKSLRVNQSCDRNFKSVSQHHKGHQDSTLEVSDLAIPLVKRPGRHRDKCFLLRSQTNTLGELLGRVVLLFEIYSANPEQKFTCLGNQDLHVVRCRYMAQRINDRSAIRC